MSFEPHERVELHVVSDKRGQPAYVLSAVVIQSSSKRVYLRVTLPDGRWAYRWVSQAHVRRLPNA